MTLDVVYWVDGAAVIGYQENPLPTIENAPCVDVGVPQRMPYFRYGKFSKTGGWKHIPKEKLPKEFLLELLILGVG